MAQLWPLTGIVDGPRPDRRREARAPAAAGLTNQEIAERLVPSVRTVEGHLYRTCTNPGEPNRAALAALLA